MYHVLGADLYFGGAQKSMWAREGEVETGLSLKLGFSGRDLFVGRREEKGDSQLGGGWGWRRKWQYDMPTALGGSPESSTLEGYKGPKQRIWRGVAV